MKVKFIKNKNILFNVNTYLFVLGLLFSFSCSVKKKKTTEPNLWEKTVCCRAILEDSLLGWCEKMDQMQDCEYHIPAACTDALVSDMIRITNLPPSVQNGEFGWQYFTDESLDKDIEMWKKALGCPTDTISKKP